MKIIIAVLLCVIIALLSILAMINIDHPGITILCVFPSIGALIALISIIVSEIDKENNKEYCISRETIQWLVHTKSIPRKDVVIKALDGNKSIFNT